MSGAVAGRTKFIGYLAYSVVLTAFIYPVVVGWKWGGGWLASGTASSTSPARASST